MVRSQTGLLVWLISNYKGQVKLSLQTHRHKRKGEERERKKGVMQALAQGDKGMLARSLACSSCTGKRSISSNFFVALQHSRQTQQPEDRHHRYRCHYLRGAPAGQSPHLPGSPRPCC